MKFGTLIEDSQNSHHGKFGVSYSIALVSPPTVQNFTHVYAIIMFFNHKGLWLSFDSLAQVDSIANHQTILEYHTI